LNNIYKFGSKDGYHMHTNLDYIKGITESNELMIRELVAIFKEQVLELSVQLKDMLEKKDWDKLSKLAHKAKSTVAVMGMAEMANELKNLELWAHERINVENYGRIVEKFIFVSKEALEELKEYI
jgi:HPt (histidine-containing phosphotransfer) domain-containing protein